MKKNRSVYLSVIMFCITLLLVIVVVYSFSQDGEGKKENIKSSETQSISTKSIPTPKPSGSVKTTVNPIALRNEIVGLDKDYYETKVYNLGKDQFNIFHKLAKKNDFIDERVNIASEFLKYNQSKGRKAMFVMIPPSIIKGVTELSKEAQENDYSNRITDQTVGAMGKTGIKTLDLRPYFKNYPPEKFSYNGDHHWQNETALHAAGYTAKNVKKILKLPLDSSVDYTDIKNYKINTYKKIYDGSFNNAFSKDYFPPLDFVLPVPKWETKYDLKGYDSNGNLKVSVDKLDFLNTFFNAEDLKKKHFVINKMFHRYNYQADIHNYKAKNNLKVMVVCTSSGRPFSMYLASYVKDVYHIETWKSNLNIRQYADKINPDLVLMVYEANSMGKNACFDNLK